MSHAWESLRLAVHKLAQAGSRRERLAEAFTEYLYGLRPKDLPAEVRKDFAKLKEDIHIGCGAYIPSGQATELELIDDAEVGLMIDSIIDIYDAVTRYQPILSTSTSVSQ